MESKRQAILIGDVERAKYHPLTGFDREFQTILAEFDLHRTTDYDAFLPSRLSGYDLVVCFTDRWEPLSDAQTEGLLWFVAQGGGLLLIHNGISIQVRPELARLAGGFFTGHPEQRVLAYAPTASGHPVTYGWSGFRAKEEPYRFRLDDTVHVDVFLAYDLDGETCPAAWSRTFGAGRVVTLSPGHNLETVMVPNYRDLIRRSADWLVEQA